MLKLLVTGLILYAAYKFFFGPNALGGGKAQDQDQIRYDDRRRQQSRQAPDDEDYIDYEEVD